MAMTGRRLVMLDLRGGAVRTDVAADTTNTAISMLEAKLHAQLRHRIERRQSLDQRRGLPAGVGPAPGWVVGDVDIFGTVLAEGGDSVDGAPDLDADGVVNVSAKDLGTGREQNIRVVASSGLTEADIERIIGDRKSVV